MRASSHVVIMQADSKSRRNPEKARRRRDLETLCEHLDQTLPEAMNIPDFSNRFPYQCHTVWAGVSATCVGRFVIRGVRQSGGCGDPGPDPLQLAGAAMIEPFQHHLQSAAAISASWWKGRKSCCLSHFPSEHLGSHTALLPLEKEHPPGSALRACLPVFIPFQHEDASKRRP